jgi:transposase
MKKISKMPTRMGETIGIDLGDKVSRYCIVDHHGEVVEEGSFRNQASSLEKHFGGEPRRIALEAGSQSAWISRELKRLGHEVLVANPRELKWITSSDTKNDPGDARKLALLARVDVRLLAPVEHRTAEQQAELAVIRARDAILRARTLLINSARSLAKGFGLRLPKSITGTFGERAIEGLPEFLRTALSGLLQQIDAISREITGYDQKIGALAGRHAELARLESIPGVGRLTAMTFVLTLGRVERFAHSRDVSPDSWACGPSSGRVARAIRNWVFPKAAILICASCWCSAPITFWVLTAKIRRSGNGDGPRAKAARKPRCGRSSQWPGSYPCCCTGCG